MHWLLLQIWPGAQQTLLQHLVWQQMPPHGKFGDWQQALPMHVPEQHVPPQQGLKGAQHWPPHASWGVPLGSVQQVPLAQLVGGQHLPPQPVVPAAQQPPDWLEFGLRHVSLGSQQSGSDPNKSPTSPPQRTGQHVGLYLASRAHVAALWTQ
jgi:hypothetical protein